MKSTANEASQLKAARAQAAAGLAEKQRELAIALKELADVRYELARRDTAEAFAKAPSPSTMMH
jgi:hypothetical protein